MEHILPKSLAGTDARDNLAASCYRCNEFKGAKTHARDPQTGQLVSLFHPRNQSWLDQFTWSNGGTHIIGKSVCGKLRVFRPERKATRVVLTTAAFYR